MPVWKSKADIPHKEVMQLLILLGTEDDRYNIIELVCEI
jgi:hypothetical protein